MIEIGKKQELLIAKEVDFGVYLAEMLEADQENRVLLPKKQIPQDAKRGDTLQVFIYKDSDDRLIATMREPLLQIGEMALLTVKEVTRIGAFLDWGLEKDLLLPYAEQTKQLHEGEACLAALYLDKSSRLCATMKIYPYLRTQSPYHIGDEVDGRVYEVNEYHGVYIAVDDQYSAMIPKQEAQGNYRVGDILHLRVTEVKEDGKLSVSARDKAYMQMDEDAASVYEIIRDDFVGSLPFDDKASPETIQREFGLSKAAFKRAVGHLYKERMIELKDGKIFVVEKRES